MPARTGCVHRAPNTSTKSDRTRAPGWRPACLGHNGMVTPTDNALSRFTPRALWRHSAVRYLVTGGFCFVVDAGMIWVGHDLLGVPLAVATPVAFLLSFVVTYALQRIVAFGADNGVAPSALRYTALVGVNMIATTVIVWAISATGAPWIVGKVIAVAATTIWNFFLYKNWVFAPDKSRREGLVDAH